jgi:DNA (cytosine-5)-methyltransferase 1
VKPTFGSLFAGVGGFDMGMEKAGWDCKFQVEWDKHCRSVLDRHWADVEKWGDILNVNGRFLPPVDCIVFGSPCQDLSVGKANRAGIDGERSSLFYEAMRIIKEMRDATGGTFPRYSIWENVAGALTSNRGADFGRVIDEMANNGALVIEWAVLDAQWFLPQRRKRIFTIAIYDAAAAERCSNQIFHLSESVQRNIEQSKSQRKNPARTITKGFTTDDNDGQSLREQSYAESSFGQFKEGDVACLKASGGVLGGGSETIIVTASTTAVRKLTPLECERLQGFPDDHTRYKADGTEQSDSARYKQCGNAVAVPVAKWVGERLMNVHRAAYPVTPLV